MLTTLSAFHDTPMTPTVSSKHTYLFQDAKLRFIALLDSDDMNFFSNWDSRSSYQDTNWNNYPEEPSMTLFLT